jgi:hypothetical protein
MPALVDGLLQWQDAAKIDVRWLRVYTLIFTPPVEQKRARVHQEWEQVQQEVADEFGEASIDELLTGLRRLLATSERLNAA